MIRYVACKSSATFSFNALTGVHYNFTIIRFSAMSGKVNSVKSTSAVKRTNPGLWKIVLIMIIECKLKVPGFRKGLVLFKQ